MFRSCDLVKERPRYVPPNEGRQLARKKIKQKFVILITNMFCFMKVVSTIEKWTNFDPKSNGMEMKLVGYIMQKGSS
jgi:hypothetical protein